MLESVMVMRYATAVVFHLPWCQKCAEKHRAFCKAAKLSYDPVEVRHTSVGLLQPAAQSAEWELNLLAQSNSNQLSRIASLLN